MRLSTLRGGLARIIHQPQKSTREKVFAVRTTLTATSSQAHPEPKTSASGCPGSAQIGRPRAVRTHVILAAHLGLQQALGTGAVGALNGAHRACRVGRTHANKVKLRRTTSATGHDAGNDILIRSLLSCTRAPSLNKPTVCLDVISLLASGCGYNRGEIESRVAQ